MRYKFIGTVIEIDGIEKITDTYNFLITDKQIELDDLYNILSVLENPETSINKKYIKKILEKILDE